MKMKKCFECGEKLPFSKFYKHKQMADGYLGKCKTCTKKTVSIYKEFNLDRIREYDRKRNSRCTKAYADEYRTKFPNKYKAHTLVGNAIRDKKLYREICEDCENKSTHAHHDDYLKPLNVRWLCAIHHKQWHSNNGEGLNP